MGDESEEPAKYAVTNRTSALGTVIKFGMAAVVVGAVGAGGVIGYQQYQELRRDDQAFQIAQAGGSVDHYNTYLRLYPQGRHATEANNGIEEAVWKSTPQTAGGLNAYLRRFPNGLHAFDAQERLDELAWTQANAQGTFTAYDSYAQQFPAGRHAQEVEAKVSAMVACNTRYARNELERLRGGGNLAEAGSEGASNIYSSKQGTPTSNTYFNGNSATTYYHDGTFTSQDSIRVSYRIKNNSMFLVYREVAGTVSYRTKAGAFWRGALGAWLGAAVGSVKSDDPNQGMKDGAVAGAKAGYAAAQHSQNVTVSSSISPGSNYSGSTYVPAKYKVLNSEFKVQHIQAEIDEALLRRKVAPGC